MLRIKPKKIWDKSVIGYDVDSWLWRMGTAVLGYLTMFIARILVFLQRKFTLVNDQQLYACVENRDRPVITISNHHSMIDCAIIAALVKCRYFLEPLQLVPWVPSAKDVVHRTKLGSLYIRLIKSLPISRGGGVYQPVMDVLVDRLNRNEWVHIFPEGKINKHKERLPYKSGIGRLITEPENQPIVLPLYMLGTDDMLPMEKPFRPRIGKEVTVVVGEPVQFSDEVTEAIKSRPSDKETWVKIAEELHICIDALQVKAEKIHNK